MISSLQAHLQETLTSLKFATKVCLPAIHGFCRWDSVGIRLTIRHLGTQYAYRDCEETDESERISKDALRKAGFKGVKRLRLELSTTACISDDAWVWSMQRVLIAE